MKLNNEAKPTEAKAKNAALVKQYAFLNIKDLVLAVLKSPIIFIIFGPPQLGHLGPHELG